MHGPRAQYIARRPLTAEEASKRPPDGSRTAVGFERVASLPDPQAERYLELQYQLHKACPRYMRDTDGAPESEFRAAERLTGLGDQAILAARGRSTNPNDPENSGVRWSYTVEVRIGTLLVTVTTEQAAEGSPDDVVALAARAAQHVRDTLHAQAPTPTSSGGAGFDGHHPSAASDATWGCRVRIVRAGHLARPLPRIPTGPARRRGGGPAVWSARPPRSCQTVDHSVPATSP